MDISVYIESEESMEIGHIVDYSYETAIPQNSLARDFEEFHRIQLALIVPKRENESEMVQYLQQWSKTGQNEETYYRSATVYINSGRFETGIRFPDARMQLSRSSLTQNDVFHFSLILEQKESRYRYIETGWPAAEKVKNKLRAYAEANE